MGYRFRASPITVSLRWAVLLLVVWVVLDTLIFSLFHGVVPPEYMSIVSGAVRFIVAVPAVWIYGVYMGENGWRATFSTRGWRGGLRDSAALLMFPAAVLLPSVWTLIQADTWYVGGSIAQYIGVFIIFDPANSLFEEVIWRGLIMTAVLYRYGKTAKGRFCVAFVSSLVFGLLHYSNGWAGIVVAAVCGFGLAALYIRTESLLMPIIIHTVINFFARPFVTSSRDFLSVPGIICLAIVFVFALWQIKYSDFPKGREPCLNG